MSASWNKKIVTLPTLPPELWLHIFDFATYVPHLFDSEVQNPFSSSPSSPTYPDYASDEKFRQAVRAALVTKRYLVRVCKQWHALATPLLYAAIYVGWERHLPQLRDTLTSDADRARTDTTGTASQPKGWWTRRVDLAMRAGRTSADQWTPAPETHSAALLQLIRCFPNLEILSALWDNSFLMQSGPRFQAELALALRHTSGHALRKLVWPNVCDVVNGLTALRTVGSIPDLIVFPCPLAAAFPPSLSYLWLAGDYSCALPHVHPTPLPALRQISVHDHHLVEFPCLADFLAIQGPRLETVRVHLHTDRPDGLGALLRALCDACANLRHLVLSMDRRWEELDVLGAGDRAECGISARF
ncbi:hypothetical protein EVG20_g7144 [Dentipellis fragilis]|uniref:Uncharacterized protein n=1 Tax=Dentipellis fragilis TaxID=205917 RepID=A0A4Y9YGS6_9AGAM|nr:hypothetical protein EVG20_g7144 [Dentipellis fragilis]